MLKNLGLLSLFFILEACGQQSSSNSSAISEEFQLQQEVVQSSVDAAAGDRSLKFQNTAGHERVTIEGSTGTIDISKTNDTNEDGITKTRTLVFTNFTPKRKSRVSNLNGTVTYTLTKPSADQTQADITRSITGTLTGTFTKKDGSQTTFTKTFNTVFTYDPADTCIKIGTELDPERCKAKELPREDALKARGELIEAVVAWVKKYREKPIPGLAITESLSGTFIIDLNNFTPPETKHWSLISGSLVYVAKTASTPGHISGEITATITKKNGRTATVSVKIDTTFERDNTDNCLKLTGGFKAGEHLSDKTSEKDAEHCSRGSD